LTEAVDFCIRQASYRVSNLIRIPHRLYAPGLNADDCRYPLYLNMLTVSI
jgi:hypothetical protein